MLCIKRCPKVDFSLFCVTFYTFVTPQFVYERFDFCIFLDICCTPIILHLKHIGLLVIIVLICWPVEYEFLASSGSSDPNQQQVDVQVLGTLISGSSQFNQETIINMIIYQYHDNIYIALFLFAYAYINLWIDYTSYQALKQTWPVQRVHSYPIIVLFTGLVGHVEYTTYQGIKH